MKWFQKSGRMFTLSANSAESRVLCALPSFLHSFPSADMAVVCGSADKTLFIQPLPKHKGRPSLYAGCSLSAQAATTSYKKNTSFNCNLQTTFPPGPHTDQHVVAFLETGHCCWDDGRFICFTFCFFLFLSFLYPRV